jgi:hypothetical protein
MKQLLLIAAFCLSTLMVIGQVNIVDKGEVFEVYTSSTYRSTHPKGLCYIDIDANGRLGIRRTANGSQVTSFAATSAYQVNGSSYGSQALLVSALSSAIFREPCGVASGCTYSAVGVYPLAFVCLEILADTFNLEEFNLFGIGVIDNSESEIILYQADSSDFPIFRSDIVAGLVSSFDDQDGKYRLDSTSSKVCIYIEQTLDTDSNSYVFAIQIDSTDQNTCEAFLWTGQFDSDSFVCEYNANEYSGITFFQQGTFQVFRSGWQTVSFSGGTFSSNEAFTQWRIIDSEENVIDSGLPTINCD